MAVTFHEFPLTQLGVGTTRELGGLTDGPDGALYFGLFANNTSSQSATPTIGRITPDGSISQLPLPPSVAPGLITAGPDGPSGFLGVATQIDRITTDGKLTAFATSLSSDEGAVSLAAGPDGALWFPTANSSQVILDGRPFP